MQVFSFHASDFTSEGERRDYRFACDDGKAPADKLERALRTGKLKANGSLHWRAAEVPLIGAPILYGMVENTKLLLEHGAKAGAQVNRWDKKGRYCNLMDVCLTSDWGSETSKLAIAVALNQANQDWIQDRDCNVLSWGARGRNNGLALEYLLRQPGITNLEWGEASQGVVGVLAIRGYFRAARLAMDKGFRWQKDALQIWQSIWIRREKNGENLALGRRLMSEATGRLAFEEFMTRVEQWERQGKQTEGGHEDATQAWKSAMQKAYLDSTLGGAAKEVDKPRPKRV